jgi:glycosyltransferase 2 family protein
MTAALSSADSNRTPVAPFKKPAGLAWTSVALSVAVVAATVALADTRRVWAELSSIDTRWLSAAFALGLVQLAVLGLRWSRVANELGLPLGWLRATSEYALSTLGNQVLPSGIAGDGLRALRHAKNTGERGLLPVLEALALDRASGQIALWLVVLVSAPLTVHAGIVDPTAVLVGGIALFGCVALGVFIAARVPRLQRLLARARRVLWRGAVLLLSPRGAAIHLPLSLLFVACTLLQLYVAARAIGVVLPWLSLLWLGPLILVAASVPTFFGGWGIREGASALLFAAAGMPQSTGVAVSMVYGTFALVISLPGLLVLVFDSERTRERTGESNVWAFGGTWAYASALSVVLGTLLSLWLETPSVLAAIAALCFFVFVAQARRSWTPQGRFGLANGVTTARLVITLWFLLTFANQPGWLLAAVALASLLLDLVDGWLARRAGLSSEFGALFDMETDALFVLTLALALFSRGVAGPWVIMAGLWRYLYVLAPACIPASGVEDKRSRHGRLLYVTMMACFVVALAVPPSAGWMLALIGTIAVSISFVHSFWQLYVPVGKR